MHRKPLFAAAAALTLTAVSADAATITGVTIEAVSSEFGNGLRNAENLINGSGFDEANGFHSNAGGNNINWINDLNTGFPHSVTFDLEANYDLDSVKVWNWNTLDTLDAGVKDVTISVASSVGGSFTSLGAFVLTIAPGADNVDFGQVIDLSGFAAADDARLVKFDITTNHGFSAYPLAGLSEVRFDAVPEPGSLALMGLGGICLLRRRR